MSRNYLPLDTHLYITACGMPLPSAGNFMVDNIYNEEATEWARPWADVLVCHPRVIVDSLWEFLDEPKVIYLGEPDLITRCDYVTTPHGLPDLLDTLWRAKFIPERPPFTLNTISHALTYSGISYSTQHVPSMTYLTRILRPFFFNEEVSAADLEIKYSPSIWVYFSWARELIERITDHRWTISGAWKTRKYRLCPIDEAHNSFRR